MTPPRPVAKLEGGSGRSEMEEKPFAVQRIVVKGGSWRAEVVDVDLCTVREGGCFHNLENTVLYYGTFSQLEL